VIAALTWQLVTVVLGGLVIAALVVAMLVIREGVIKIGLFVERQTEEPLSPEEWPTQH